MSRRAPIALAATILLTLAAAVPPAGAATPHWYGLLHAINKTRAAHHLRPVHPAPRLHWAARGHSRDMLVRHYFAHTSPTGSTLYDRIVHSGFRTYGAWTAGETLAWGAGSWGMPGKVVKMWLASPEHRAILLSPRYAWVGIGRAYGRFKGYRNTRIWTVDWGQR